MKAWFKSLFSSPKTDMPLRTLNSLAELQQNDYIKVNDSFALPDALRGSTFQVSEIAGYYYGDRLQTEWTLTGNVRKKIYLSLHDSGDEERVVFSYQLSKQEVDTIFGWENIRRHYQSDYEAPLLCKDTAVIEGWLGPEYYRRECDASAVYFSQDCRGRNQPAGGDDLRYFDFYNGEGSLSLTIEVWSKEEVDVFVSILRPVSDIHEFWAVR